MDRNTLLRIDFRHPQTWNVPVEVTLDNCFFENLEQEELTGGDVQAKLEMRQTSADNYNLHIRVKGSVNTLCDRCLEEVKLQIDAEEDVLLTFDSKTSDDDALIIPAKSPVFDAAWTIYEIIVTSLPIERKHPDGECAEDMMALINS